MRYRHAEPGSRRTKRRPLLRLVQSAEEIPDVRIHFDPTMNHALANAAGLGLVHYQARNSIEQAGNINQADE